MLLVDDFDARKKALRESLNGDVLALLHMLTLSVRCHLSFKDDYENSMLKYVERLSSDHVAEVAQLQSSISRQDQMLQDSRREMQELQHTIEELQQRQQSATCDFNFELER